MGKTYRATSRHRRVRRIAAWDYKTLCAWRKQQHLAAGFNTSSWCAHYRRVRRDRAYGAAWFAHQLELNRIEQHYENDPNSVFYTEWFERSSWRKYGRRCQNRRARHISKTLCLQIVNGRRDHELTVFPRVNRTVRGYYECRS